MYENDDDERKLDGREGEDAGINNQERRIAFLWAALLHYQIDADAHDESSDS